MATTKPEGPVAPFNTFLTEEDRGWQGVYGLPNTYRIDADGREVPVDPEREQSGGLSDAPSVAPSRFTTERTQGPQELTG